MAHTINTQQHVSLKLGDLSKGDIFKLSNGTSFFMVTDARTEHDDDNVPCVNMETGTTYEYYKTVGVSKLTNTRLILEVE